MGGGGVSDRGQRLALPHLALLGVGGPPPPPPPCSGRPAHIGKVGSFTAFRVTHSESSVGRIMLQSPESLWCIEEPSFHIGRGTYLLAATKFNQPDNRAHVVSPYILSSRSTCVSFYYQVRGGTLNIRTKTHKNALTTVWSRSGAVAMTEWERGYQRLPHGYLRLVVEASTKKSSALLNIAIDDITIGECGEGKIILLYLFSEVNIWYNRFDFKWYQWSL